VFPDEDFDGPDDGVEETPFDFLEDVAYCFGIVELPRKKNTKGKRASQDRKAVKEVKVDFRSDVKSLDSPTEFLKAENGSNLLSAMSLMVDTNWPAMLTYRAIRILSTIGTRVSGSGILSLF
jgi:hypothetical protein